VFFLCVLLNNNERSMNVPKLSCITYSTCGRELYRNIAILNNDYKRMYGGGADGRMSPRIITIVYVLILDAIRRSEPDSRLLDKYSPGVRVPKYQLKAGTTWQSVFAPLLNITPRTQRRTIDKTYSSVLKEITSPRPETGPMGVATSGSPLEMEVDRELEGMAMYMRRGDTPEFLRRKARELTDKYGEGIWYLPRGIIVGASLAFMYLTGQQDPNFLALAAVGSNAAVSMASIIWSGITTQYNRVSFRWPITLDDY